MKNQLQQYRSLLDEILNQLIPANAEKNIPAAGSAGVGDFIETRASEDETVSVALKDLLSNALTLNQGVSVEMVKTLEIDHRENFKLLVNLTYMGYYSRPEIRSLVGVGSWPVHPKGYDVPPEPAELIERLIAPVRDRGAMYKNPDDQPQRPS